MTDQFIKNEVIGIERLLSRFKTIFKIMYISGALVAFLSIFGLILNSNKELQKQLLSVHSIIILIMISNTILIISHEVLSELSNKLIRYTAYVIKDNDYSEFYIKELISEKQKRILINFIESKKKYYEEVTKKYVTLQDVENFIKRQR